MGQIHKYVRRRKKQRRRNQDPTFHSEETLQLSSLQQIEEVDRLPSTKDFLEACKELKEEMERLAKISCEQMGLY